MFSPASVILSGGGGGGYVLSGQFLPGRGLSGILYGQVLYGGRGGQLGNPTK